MTKSEITAVIRQAITETSAVLSAVIYGSWLYNESSVDRDIAVLVPSRFGIVAGDIYRDLWDLRSKLTNSTGRDVDLIPHTVDELTDERSPLRTFHSISCNLYS